MFKKFFSIIVKAIKSYIDKHGIIRTIANAVEGVIVSSGIVAVATNAFKRWKTRRNLNKTIKDKEISHKDILDVGSGVYDDNGYRMTNEEIYRKNKQTMDEIDSIYTDENRECVELIEKFEPRIFKGMTKDDKFKYVYNHNINSQDLRKRYSLDKESQLRIGRQEIDELNKAWDEDEEPKISAASRVPAGYRKDGGRQPKITSKKQGIMTCSVMDYAAMEITYGCEDFNFTDPNSETQERKLRRLKFDETVEVVNSYISYIYLYDKPRWNNLMKKANGDATKIWNFMMIAFLDDVKSFNEAREFLKNKGEELRGEIRGHHRSSRPKLTSLEQDELLDKFEDVYEHLNSIENNQRLNQDPNQFVFDEDEDDDDEIDINEDAVSNMEGTDDILDQLDALRSGQTGVPEEIDEPVERKPVKMITHDDQESEEQDPTVIYINRKEYTIEKRAELMLKSYHKEYLTNGDLAASNLITSMLEDSEGKNYKLYEVSDHMKNVRYDDRKKGLSFKLIPSDYDTPEEKKSALTDWQSFSAFHGSKNYLAMVKERSDYYQEQFEYQTVDAMLAQLKTFITDHDEQVAFIRCLKDADHDYSNNILTSDCADLDQEASIPLPMNLKEVVIEDNTSEEVTPEELGVAVSEVRNLHNKD